MPRIAVSSRRKISTGAGLSGSIPQVLLFFSSEKHPKDPALPGPPDFIR
jgi:hypothetical protein